MCGCVMTIMSPGVESREGNHGVADKPVVPLLAPLRRLREVERPLDLKHRLAKRVTPDGMAKYACVVVLR